jgi:2OG-Fe(II) oxygenase superfamily
LEKYFFFIFQMTIYGSPKEPLQTEISKIPGIVVIRESLTSVEQKRLIEIITRKGGLKENGEWNFIAGRGRHFSKIKKYEKLDCEYIQQIVIRFKNQVENLDPLLQFDTVTHVLTLVYPTTKGLNWHVDDYGGNNGDFQAPVYSLTLGNSCVFSYKPVGFHDTYHIKLQSGDLIVFGGPQREMLHAVEHVIQDKSDLRYNLTFRTCTNFTDEEEAFYQTKPYKERLQAKWELRKKNF